MNRFDGSVARDRMDDSRARLPRHRQVAVVGAGALGQTYAAILSRGGASVTLVASAGTGRRLGDQGEIRLHGALDLTVPVTVNHAAAPARINVIDGEPREAVEGIIFATKGQDLEAVAHRYSEWSTNWVFGIQNGLMKDDVLCSSFGAETVLGGTSTLAAQRLDDGSVRMATPGVTFVGPYQQRSSAKAVRAVELFTAVGLSAEIVDDPVQVEWAKVLQAAPAFAVQLIVRDSPMQLWGDPVQAKAALMVMREIGEIARHAGVEIRDFTMLPSHQDLTEDEASTLARRGAGIGAWADGEAFRSSLLQDLVAGRPTEAGHIFQDLVRRADSHRLDVPVVRFIAALSERL